ncbi:hypothetical protein RFI_11016, partial [Reticulomyxa filosa]
MTLLIFWLFSFVFCFYLCNIMRGCYDISSRTLQTDVEVINKLQKESKAKQRSQVVTFEGENENESNKNVMSEAKAIFPHYSCVEHMEQCVIYKIVPTVYEMKKTSAILSVFMNIQSRMKNMLRNLTQSTTITKIINTHKFVTSIRREYMLFYHEKLLPIATREDVEYYDLNAMFDEVLDLFQ